MTERERKDHLLQIFANIKPRPNTLQIISGTALAQLTDNCRERLDNIFANLRSDVPREAFVRQLLERLRDGQRIDWSSMQPEAERLEISEAAYRGMMENMMSNKTWIEIAWGNVQAEEMLDGVVGVLIAETHRETWHTDIAKIRDETVRVAAQWFMECAQEGNVCTAVAWKASGVGTGNRQTLFTAVDWLTKNKMVTDNDPTPISSH